MNTGFETKRIKFGLKRIKIALKKAGFKENFSSVLIAGSVGKSQTAIFLEQLLLQQNLKVGTYISPHLFHIGERVRIQGREISRSTYYRYLRPFQNQNLTYFEKLTAGAFIFFSEKKIDIAVVEVGLGGRRDATNVLKNEVAIITPITLEHTDWLGETREKIAKEKAGIIKKNSIVICQAEGIARKVIKEIARKKSAKFVNPEFVNGPYPVKFLSENFSVALKAFCEMGYRWDGDFPRNILPVRFEVFKKSGRFVIIDGGHTINSARAILKELKKFPAPRICVFYPLKDKKITEILMTFGNNFAKIFCGGFPHERRTTPENLKLKIPGFIKEHVEILKDVEDCFKKALSQKAKTILCFGSIIGSAYLKEKIFEKSSWY
ncbi:MAG: hypothetical protein J7L42_04135 [Elusimicrobia bacterium]|nr:hypothetical protein [Elusimicrobiota bacterium]